MNLGRLFPGSVEFPVRPLDRTAIGGNFIGAQAYVGGVDYGQEVIVVSLALKPTCRTVKGGEIVMPSIPHDKDPDTFLLCVDGRNFIRPRLVGFGRHPIIADVYLASLRFSDQVGFALRTEPDIAQLWRLKKGFITARLITMPPPMPQPVKPAFSWGDLN